MTDTLSPQQLADLCRQLDAESPPSLSELAITVGLSPWQLHRQFRHQLGCTPARYAERSRVERLKQALGEAPTVLDATTAAGYSSSSRAHRAATEHLGMTLTRWRKGGEGETIDYAMSDCWLGKLLVGFTERGICLIELGDSSIELEASLNRRFDRAQLRLADASLQAFVVEIVAFVDDPARGLDLPLDLSGSAFQLRVWTALRELAAGETRSYADIAKRIGTPSASRAVAGACAANRLAIVIPCHRILASNGDLSGYRWGRQRKAALLQREASPIASAS
ncbi:methylated-DNA--[protein]-cysteine S-methyltransferase [Gammaproteobacteria bacterium]|nr:methylated-DNA--[protein]-cysteine S-methyltransferase [Gammaproteobacteria bacterium]